MTSEGGCLGQQEARTGSGFNRPTMLCEPAHEARGIREAEEQETGCVSPVTVPYRVFLLLQKPSVPTSSSPINFL